MKRPVIKRYISDNKAFEDIISDFQFLVDKIKQSGFEYDLQIRNNYFNLYYKGNSIGKITYKKGYGYYEVIIHHLFIDDKIKKRFNPVLKNRYLIFTIPRKQLHPLFSSQNLKSMASRVKKVDFQEEIIYEQMLMTDNINRDDFLIIDRQVMDKVSKTKMDLLALKRKNGNKYQFCVLEVKLGNNPELEGDVISQLKGYVNKIETHFDDYKNCYEHNFIQKQKLGLIDKPSKIEITGGVIGAIVALGYSGIAKQKIKKLKQTDPSVTVIQLSNRIDLKKLNL
jgi:hypothetical protein